MEHRFHVRQHSFLFSQNRGCAVVCTEVEVNKHMVGSINEILATRARATFSHRINFEAVGYKTLPKMKTWCDENCQGLWRNEQVHALYFQFENDRDATMFMLRWGTAEGNKLK